MSGIRVAGASSFGSTGIILEVIVIVVLGGTPLRGGKGDILGTVLAGLTIRLILLGVVFLKLENSVFMLLLGGFLIVYCILFQRQT
jgi:ribose/xylose/arabinose/galactoside ABC-type transport system permease subunit